MAAQRMPQYMTVDEWYENECLSLYNYPAP